MNKLSVPSTCLEYPCPKNEATKFTPREGVARERVASIPLVVIECRLRQHRRKPKVHEKIV